MSDKPSYWDYLRLDRLLDLQGGLEGHESALLPDELHFIIVHQVYELWFKLMLREMRLARNHLDRPQVDEQIVPHVVHHLGRVESILRLLVSQFEVIETLTPQDFLAFRDKLVPSSGFQSFQMREVEILMGLETAGQKRIKYGTTDPIEHIQKEAGGTGAGQLALRRLREVRAERSLLQALEHWLTRTPIQGSTPEDADDDANISEFVRQYLSRLKIYQAVNLERMVDALGEEKREGLQTRFTAIADAAAVFLSAEDAPVDDRSRRRRIRVAVLFIESYRNLPLLSWPRLLLDAFVELEEQFVLWRHRHARMVERVIGRRVGTGGSEGVAYLDKTTQYRVFNDLWTARSLLMPKTELPPLLNARDYGFATD